jgi:DNA-binding GntR family transcriptional regulator
MRTPLPQVPQQRVLTDWVTDCVREAILRGHLDPGEKLDQEMIARELDVSRTPVREALSKLESEGFVEVRPHRGAFVVMPSEQDIGEVYELLGILEAEVVRQTTPFISESLLQELDTRLAQDEDRLKDGDLSTFVEVDRPRFPTALFDFIDSRLLREIMASLSNRIEIARHLMRFQQPLLSESLNEHKAILESMRQRNAERAAELTRLHLKKSAERILALRRQSDGSEREEKWR